MVSQFSRNKSFPIFHHYSSLGFRKLLIIHWVTPEIESESWVETSFSCKVSKSQGRKEESWQDQCEPGVRCSLAQLKQSSTPPHLPTQLGICRHSTEEWTSLGASYYKLSSLLTMVFTSLVNTRVQKEDTPNHACFCNHPVRQKIPRLKALQVQTR